MCVCVINLRVIWAAWLDRVRFFVCLGKLFGVWMEPPELICASGRRDTDNLWIGLGCQLAVFIYLPRPVSQSEFASLFFYPPHFCVFLLWTWGPFRRGWRGVVDIIRPVPTPLFVDHRGHCWPVLAGKASFYCRTATGGGGASSSVS